MCTCCEECVEAAVRNRRDKSRLTTNTRALFVRGPVLELTRGKTVIFIHIPGMKRKYINTGRLSSFPQLYGLYCALSLAAQCIVIGPACGFVCAFVCVCVCVWVCYHDNSKLRASILTKLGSDHLQLIKFWPSRAPGKGSVAGRNLGPPQYLCIG